MVTTVKVQDLTSLGSIADGDVFVGEKVTGTTGKITFNGVIYDADFVSNGLMTRTAAGVYTNRTVTGVTNRTTITNGNGVSGDPTIDISSSYVGQNTITTLGTIGTGTWQASTLAVSYGGTGLTSATAYAPLVGGTTSTGAHQSVAVGTAGQVLRSGGNAAVPAYSTATFASTYAASSILYSNGADTVTGLATANNGVLGTNGSGVPSITSTPRMTAVKDTNGNNMAAFGQVASSVNYVTLMNSATNVGPEVQATGTDSNINLYLRAKGSGALLFISGASRALYFLSGTGSQHTTQFDFADTNNTRTITFPDTDITVKTDVGITGATNATAGNLGEVITATGSAVAITTATQTNVTSISLTAGDWLVYGMVKSNPAAGTTVTEVAGGVSTTTATLPTIYAATGTGGATIATGPTVPCTRINVSGTTTVYLVARIAYAVSTCTVSGTISGVRIR